MGAYLSIVCCLYALTFICYRYYLLISIMSIGFDSCNLQLNYKMWNLKYVFTIIFEIFGFCIHFSRHIIRIQNYGKFNDKFKCYFFTGTLLAILYTLHRHCTRITQMDDGFATFYIWKVMQKISKFCWRFTYMERWENAQRQVYIDFWLEIRIILNS